MTKVVSGHFSAGGEVDLCGIPLNLDFGLGAAGGSLVKVLGDLPQ